VLLLPEFGLIAMSFARGRQKTQYDTAYLRLGRNLFCHCNSRFYAYGSARYLGVAVIRSIKAVDVLSGSLNTFYDKSEFQGGGLELGIGGEYRLGCGFNLVGQLGILALLGNRTDFFRIVSTVSTSARLAPRNILKCAPGIDCRLAMNYTYNGCLCGCNWRLVGEIGWEMDYYWSVVALRKATFVETNSIADAARLDPTNFGTNGPYGSLTIRF
jgi:hypothetical protein